MVSPEEVYSQKYTHELHCIHVKKGVYPVVIVVWLQVKALNAS